MEKSKEFDKETIFVNFVPNFILGAYRMSQNIMSLNKMLQKEMSHCKRPRRQNTIHTDKMSIDYMPCGWNVTGKNTTRIKCHQCHQPISPEFLIEDMLIWRTWQSDKKLIFQPASKILKIKQKLQKSFLKITKSLDL